MSTCGEGRAAAKTALIRRRHVIYVEGYDPQGAEGYYGLFRRAWQRFQGPWPVRTSLGPLIVHSEDFACWDVELSSSNWRTETHYDFLRQEYMIRANMAEPIIVQIQRAIRWAADDLVSGTSRRIFRASWRFGLVLVYFQLALILWIFLAIASGAAAAAGTEWLGLVRWVAVPLGVAVGAGVFHLLRPFFDRHHVIQINNHWPLLRAFARGDATSFAGPIEACAKRLVAATRTNEVDEIVVIGHSGGGVIAPAIVAHALTLDPDLGRRGAPVTLLTLGSIMPGVALHWRATAMREIIRRLAVEPSIVWVDCQSRKDVMNFWDFDPVAGTGIAVEPQRCNPLLWIVSFKHMVSPEFYRRLRRDFFRLHYQFIMTGDRRASYDYVMLTCGPLPVAQWAGAPDRALASFGADGSLLEPRV